MNNMDDALKRAKDEAASRQRTGRGAPPVQPTPPSGPVSGPLGVPLGTALGQGSKPLPTARPAPAIASDLNRLSEAINQASAPAPAPEPEPKPVEQESEQDKEESAYSLFDDAFAENLMLSPKYRKRCERDLVPIDVTELLTHGEIRQDVPILFNKDGVPILSVTFRTVNGDEDLGVKYDMLGVEGTTRYVMDRFSIAQACIGIHSIGGKELLPFKNREGDFDRGMFGKRLKEFLRRPSIHISLLVQHYIWFNERVQAVGIVEALGNG